MDPLTVFAVAIVASLVTDAQPSQTRERERERERPLPGLPEDHPGGWRKADVEKVIGQAERAGVVEKAVEWLLSQGVPPHMIFVGKFILRYRWLFYPTVVDLLPENWQRAIDEAMRAGAQHDPELLRAFLARYGVDVGGEGAGRTP